MRTLPALGFVLALVVPASLGAQQLVLAQNDNLSYGNSAVGWPASVLGFRFTAPAAMVIDAAQVFTGNQPPAAHTVEIRTRNAATGLPDQLVGQPGSWQTVHARCWQGAQLAQPAVLAANTDYFLVWRVTGMFHQHSTSNANDPNQVQSEIRVSDGSTWHAVTTGPAKFRLFAPYAAGASTAFGTGKAGTYGVPQIGLSGWPAVGSPIDVWLDNAVRAQPTFLVIGWPIPGGLSFPMADVYVTGEVLLLVQTWLHTSPLCGAMSYTFRVPNTPAASGLPLSFQFGMIDPMATLGFAHTSAVTAHLQ
ncbi:MAG: hypothetical protein U1E73_04240 [Planctomycetota bacterium]